MSSSIVLEEDFDENYEPTAQEMKEYAEFLGIDSEKEPWLMWIAKQGLKTPLPPNWKPCQATDGSIYCFNFSTGESAWDHPADNYYKDMVLQERKRAEDKKKSSSDPSLSIKTKPLPPLKGNGQADPDTLSLVPLSPLPVSKSGSPTVTVPESTGSVLKPLKKPPLGTIGTKKSPKSPNIQLPLPIAEKDPFVKMKLEPLTPTAPSSQPFETSEPFPTNDISKPSTTSYVPEKQEKFELPLTDESDQESPAPPKESTDNEFSAGDEDLEEASSFCVSPLSAGSPEPEGLKRKARNQEETEKKAEKEDEMPTLKLNMALKKSGRKSHKDEKKMLDDENLEPSNRNYEPMKDQTFEPNLPLFQAPVKKPVPFEAAQKIEQVVIEQDVNNGKLSVQRDPIVESAPLFVEYIMEKEKPIESAYKDPSEVTFGLLQKKMQQTEEKMTQLGQKFLTERKTMTKALGSFHDRLHLTDIDYLDHGIISAEERLKILETKISSRHTFNYERETFHGNQGHENENKQSASTPMNTEHFKLEQTSIDTKQLDEGMDESSFLKATNEYIKNLEQQLKGKDPTTSYKPNAEITKTPEPEILQVENLSLESATDELVRQLNKEKKELDDAREFLTRNREVQANDRRVYSDLLSTSRKNSLSPASGSIYRSGSPAKEVAQDYSPHSIFLKRIQKDLEEGRETLDRQSEFLNSQSKKLGELGREYKTLRDKAIQLVDEKYPLRPSSPLRKNETKDSVRYMIDKVPNVYEIDRMKISNQSTKDIDSYMTWVLGQTRSRFEHSAYSGLHKSTNAYYQRTVPDYQSKIDPFIRSSVLLKQPVSSCFINSYRRY